MIGREHGANPAVLQDVWDFFGRLFVRKASLLAPAPVSLPAPRARVGRNAAPHALVRLFELFPDHATIGVVDEQQMLIEVVEVSTIKSRLVERSDAKTVRELLAS